MHEKDNDERNALFHYLERRYDTAFPDFSSIACSSSFDKFDSMVTILSSSLTSNFAPAHMEVFFIEKKLLYTKSGSSK